MEESSGFFTSKDTAEQSVVVITLFGAVWFLAGLVVLYQYFSHRRINKKKKPQHVNPLSTVTSTDSIEELQQLPRAKLEQRFQAYFFKIMPAVYRPLPQIHRMFKEVMHHHSLFQVFSHEDAVNMRLFSLHLFRLATLQTMMMFGLSLLYDLQGPQDDGSCVAHLEEQTCLARKSIFDPKQSYCKWVTDSTDYCAYQIPGYDFKATMYCAVLTSLFTTLLAKPLDVIFETLFGSLESHERTALLEKVKAVLHPPVTSTSHGIANAGNSAEDWISVAPNAHSNKVGEEKAERYSLLINEDVKAYMVDIKGLSITKKQLHKSLSGRRRSSIRLGLSKLVEELFLQRQYLQRHHPEEVAHFDHLWRIDTSSASKESYVHKVLLEKEAERIRKEYQDVVHAFTHSTHDSQGLQLLYCFMSDLLGRQTFAGKIFHAKINEDLKQTYVLSKLSCLGLLLGLLGLNAFFVYFGILRGYQRGVDWQQSFVISCIMQFIFELMIFETMECLYIHYWVPSLVDKQLLQSVQDTVVGLGIDVVKGVDLREESIFNTVNYFFVSKPLAEACPTASFEVAIVKAYCSYLPNKDLLQAFQTQDSGAVDNSTVMTKKKAQHRGYIFSGLEAVLNFSMWLAVFTVGNLSFDWQRFIIRTIQPVIMGAGALLLQLIMQNMILTICLGILFGGLGCWAVYYVMRSLFLQLPVELEAKDIEKEEVNKADVIPPTSLLLQDVLDAEVELASSSTESSIAYHALPVSVPTSPPSQHSSSSVDTSSLDSHNITGSEKHSTSSDSDSDSDQSFASLDIPPLPAHLSTLGHNLSNKPSDSPSVNTRRPAVVSIASSSNSSSISGHSRDSSDLVLSASQTKT